MYPLISVIVPIYNVEQYLIKCVESIQTQSYTNLEIILVNDGSPDKCGQICEELKSKDPRVKVIHKENGGLSDARNAGLDRAAGEYLMFLDSDDFIHSDFVKKLYERMLADGSDMAISNLEYIDETGEICKETVEVSDAVWTREQFWNELYGNKTIYCVISNAKLYKAKVFQELRFIKGKYHEDEFAIYDIVKCCDKISALSWSGYYYLQREGSIIKSEKAMGRLDCGEAHIARALKFKEASMQGLAERTLLRSIGYLLQTHDRLDSKNPIEVERYKTIKNMYNQAYWKISGKQASLRFRINAFTFVLGHGVYVMTHYKKLKNSVGVHA